MGFGGQNLHADLFSSLLIRSRYYSSERPADRVFVCVVCSAPLWGVFCGVTVPSTALRPWKERKLLLGPGIVTNHYQREAEAVGSIWCCGKNSGLNQIDNRERCERTRTPTLSAQHFHVCCVPCSSFLSNADRLTYAQPVLNPQKQTTHSHTCFFSPPSICVSPSLRFQESSPLVSSSYFNILKTADM